jgi:riboflavin synthase alpha subunit
MFVIMLFEYIFTYYRVPSSISDDGVCLTTYYSVPSSISDDGVCLTLHIIVSLALYQMMGSV